jgi:acetyl esterase/lipase
MPLWTTVPDAEPLPGPESVRPSQGLVAGRHWTAVENVARPTMTVYAPKANSTGAAVVVFPGGGFEVLAIDLEGTEICDWLTARGVTCVLLKYRVPSVPYDWHCNCRPDNLMLSKPSLQDAQRTLRLVRHHAQEWQIDPHKIGVLGFSAGGFLVAEISTNYQRPLYAPVDEADKESARPDFAMLLYPGHLVFDGESLKPLSGRNRLNPNVPVSRETPPTFLVQAQDDKVDGLKQSLVYYAALQAAGVPVEMHLYAQGGHAFGLRPTASPITGWPRLAEIWLDGLGAMAQ